MTKVIIAGGTGMVGTALCMQLLSQNIDVYIFTTQKLAAHKIPDVKYIFWNPSENYIDSNFTISDCIIINLAGANIAAKRWTTERKKEILQSRILSLKTLYNAVENKQIISTHLISTSAIGYYATSKNIHTENDLPDNQFLSQVCVQWEKEALVFNQLNVPVSILRLGIVFSSKGGAFKEFTDPLKYKVAAIPGDGKQKISWIHIKDLCQIFIYIFQHKKYGIFNATTPQIIDTNMLFDTILKYKKIYAITIHIPTWLLKIVLGEMSIEILKSTSVSSQKIIEEGYHFTYKNIEEAVKNI